MTNAEGYVPCAILTIYLDSYRRQHHWSGLKHLLADDDMSPGADRVATARVDVGVALARLSPRQREAVVLRFFEDMTVPQIATVLGTRPGTVKRYLSDAIELLRGSLAEIVAPEMDSSLDQRLDTVAGAVRRRRTAKVGAVAGASMVLAVALAWSAFAVKPWIRSEPLPAEDKIEYTSGYVPASWPEDVGIYCGMPVEELEAMDTGTFDVEIAGDLASDPRGDTAYWSLPVTISGEVPNGMFDDAAAYMTWPLIVWTHEGKVVDLPDYWREAANDETPPELVEHGTWTGLATTGNASTCRADTLVETEEGLGYHYDNERTGGRYELIVIVADPDDVADPNLPRRGLLVSDPVTVDLDSGVAPLPEFAPPSDDCSGAAYAGRELVAPGAPDGVRDTAARLLEAVSTCDERLVVELAADGLDTAWTFQEARSVNEVFALPETGGRTPYATIARLLTETQPAVWDDRGTGTWPGVATFVKNEAAWQGAIDAGAVSPAQADADRAAGKYTGWQLSIQDYARGGPTWRTFYDGDDTRCDSPLVEPPPECAEL